MDAEIGSIMGYCYKLLPIKVYTKRIPQDFEIPSIYFPKPFFTESNFTLDSFNKTYNLQVMVIYPTVEESVDKAEHLMNRMLADKKYIPLLNEDGSPTNSYIKINRIEVREGDNFATLSLIWDSQYKYGWYEGKDVNEEKMLKFFLDGVIKNG